MMLQKNAPEVIFKKKCLEMIVLLKLIVNILIKNKLALNRL